MQGLVDILDFDDSFTWNIASEFSLLGFEVSVIPYVEISDHLKSLLDSPQIKKIIVFGPGPGHPNEYVFLKSKILDLMELKNYFLMGICLGHQLLWNSLGIGIRRSNFPMHGQCEIISLPSWSFFNQQIFKIKIEVQRYNSLVLDLQSADDLGDEHIFVNKESMMGRLERGITYQFHPESVGTSYRSAFFSGIENFLYNDGDEFAYSNRRIIQPKALDNTETNFG